MEVANTLAYYDTTKIVTAKSFNVLARLVVTYRVGGNQPI